MTTEDEPRRVLTDEELRAARRADPALQARLDEAMRTLKSRDGSDRPGVSEVELPAFLREHL